MPFEQWINRRRGFDISIPDLVRQTAIVKQVSLTMHISGADTTPWSIPAFDQDVGLFLLRCPAIGSTYTA